jgi:hypothetical protein
MKELLGKMGRNALAFAAAAAALTLLAFPLAAALSSVGLISASTAAVVTSTPIVWNSAFFGAFGALVPLAEKTVGALLGSSEKPAQTMQVTNHAHTSPAIEPELVHGHGMCAGHVEKLQAQREEMAKQVIVGAGL